MCSIFGVLDIKTDAGELRKKALELSRLMRHRGPDWSGSGKPLCYCGRQRPGQRVLYLCDGDRGFPEASGRQKSLCGW